MSLGSDPEAPPASVDDPEGRARSTLWSDCRPVVRWVVLPALAAMAIMVVAVSVVSWRTAAQEPDRYETHADVALVPVVPSALYDDAAAALSPDEAMDLTLDFARRPDIQAAIDDELTFDHTVAYLRGDDDTLRVQTRADTPGNAVYAASASAEIFGQFRAEEATTRLNQVIGDLQAQVDEATGDDLQAAQRELDRAIRARDAGPTAFVVAPPETPCCLADNHERQAPVRGAIALAALGLLTAAVMLLERHRPHWTRRALAFLGRRLTAIGRRLADLGRRLAGLGGWLIALARRPLAALGARAGRVGHAVRRLWADCRPVVRWVVLPALTVIAVAVVAVTAVSWKNAVAEPDRYETHADVALVPVVPSALYDDEAAALSPDEAMDLTLDFARRPDIQAAIDGELTLDHTVDYLRGDDDTLRIRARADTPEQAADAASAAAVTFGQFRAEEATTRLNQVIGDLQAQVDEATGDDLQAAQRELDRAIRARDAGPTAFVVAPPETPCCLADNHERQAPVRGAIALAALGLLTAAVMLLERHRPHWTRRALAFLGRRLTAIGRRLGALPEQLAALRDRLTALGGRLVALLRKPFSAIAGWASRMNDRVDRVLADRPLARRLLLPVLGMVVVVTVVFALDSLNEPDRYETHVDVALVPVVPSALYDDAAAALSADEAMDLTLDFARRPGIQAAVDAQFPFDYTIDYLRADDDTLRIRTRAEKDWQAKVTASAAAAVFGQFRADDADAQLNERIDNLEALVDRATGEELVTARRQLDEAISARNAGAIAYVVAPPETPCCPIRHSRLPKVLAGVALGITLGLLLAGLMSVEHRRRSTPTGGERLHRRDRRRHAPRRDPAAWTGPAVVTALVVGRSAIYAVQGAGFLLDDYLFLFRGKTEGVVAAVGSDRLLNLPVKWLTQTVLYGISGERPLVLLTLLTLLNVGAALALYFAVARFFPKPVPLLVAGLWVLTANHSTLTVWAAASQGVVAVALGCIGVTLLSKGRWVGALAMMSASILAYEVTIPICFAAAVAVGTSAARPLDRDSVVRDVRPWQRMVMVGSLAAVVLWMSRHPTYPIKAAPFSAWELWSGHVSSGLVSTDAVSTLLLRALEVGVVAGLVLCVVAWLRGDRDRMSGPAVAVSGAAVMALGIVLSIALPGGTFGLGNRLYAASSIGTAMILVGIGLFVWNRLPRVAVAASVGLVALCLVGQVVALRAAHQAGEDVVALIDYVDTTLDVPEDARILVERRPEHDGFFGIDDLFDTYPYKLAFPGGSGTMRLTARNLDLERRRPGEVTVTWAQVHDR